MAISAETYLRLPPQKKALIWGVIGVLIAVAYWAAAARPGMDRIAKIEDDYSKQDAILREKQAVAANLPIVKEAVKQLDIHLGKALEKLPGSEEIPALLKSVSDLGVEAGLEAVLFKPGSAKPVGPKFFYAEVPFTMEYSGQYHELGSFFDKIANLSRIVAIDNYFIDTNTYTIAGDPQLKMKIEARTFRFLPPEERPKEQVAEDPKAAKGKGKGKTAPAKAGKK